MRFTTRSPAAAPDAVAPDGSEVRVLAALESASSAQFRLAAGAVSGAVAHRTVEEIWYVVEGTGRIWRSQHGREEVSDLRPGVTLTIPLGTAFQFRADERGPLVVLGVTIPPWPGDAEAVATPGPWERTA